MPARGITGAPRGPMHTDLFESAVPHPAGYRDVEPDEVLRQLGRIRVVDVREPDEVVGDLGRIGAAKLVPLATLPGVARGWPKDVAVVFVCRSGNRSGRAAAMLAANGFRRVMNMRGGMLAWNAAGHPVVR